MIFPDSGRTAPIQLLVSVQNETEARAAIAGGADLVDAKDPSRGSLGPVSTDAWRAIASAGASASIPLTAALGEWDEPAFPRGLAAARYVKMGLAGLQGRSDWRRHWMDRRAAVEQAEEPLEWVAVAYADAERADAPGVEDVLAATLETTTAGLLVDTYVKDGRTTFDYLAVERLIAIREELHAAGRFLALAGRVTGRHWEAVRHIAPDILAVRTAACRDGRRDGPVVVEQVARLKRLIGGQRENGSVNIDGAFERLTRTERGA